ncbi:Hsp20/alpha crystallin family protein [Chlorobium phaeovibrioides]|uniref:Hsp20/alpha crystallin family protein n=1 Tax=Chlorobium phaeovibrioides TaxID=1094 RepID=A0A432ATP9_CHLPH|nr:Hsp20/alpha crystallin family protein [Chlorobium phaeovibrioides]KAA6232432.1 Hsp20/alpha crystallin family protein [Chlorobium phaeovibrioides]MWV55072.1 Hsp20/alpha crystallin family protein [Chlorobium phaeovibrioides]RTY35985.1 Hsp20/alpha crystallin family protein [Chlorobium phaeovibrioides]RTY37260.1 Hsp20/alpha crystallin family protein [Chlorobium phaeovibrioides]
MDRDREREKRENEESDFDLSGLGALGQGLGGLFKGIERLVDLASKLESSGGTSGSGEVNLEHLRKGMKGVYGFTIKSAGGGGGSPKVETFGNIRKSAEGPKVDEEREPITDLFDEEDRIVVIVEMPGLEAEDIILDLNGDILSITTKGSGKRYRKELLLPMAVAGQEPQRKYTNGILEITISK